jgi:hypothetical protein
MVTIAYYRPCALFIKHLDGAVKCDKPKYSNRRGCSRHRIQCYTGCRDDLAVLANHKKFADAEDNLDINVNRIVEEVLDIHANRGRA